MIWRGPIKFQEYFLLNLLDSYSIVLIVDHLIDDFLVVSVLSLLASMVVNTHQEFSLQEIFHLQDLIDSLSTQPEYILQLLWVLLVSQVKQPDQGIANNFGGWLRL
jgi:hypothetical protein